MLHRVNQSRLADRLLRYVEWWEQLREPRREGCLAPGAKIESLQGRQVNLLYSRCFQHLSMVAILSNAGWITYLTVTWQGL